jgi:membrane-bound lytic murein transglycosylase F
MLVFIYFFLLSPVNRLNQWQKIEAKGYLTWVTRPSPLTYYISLDGVIGLEHDILKRFCKSHNIKLKVILADSNYELFEMFDGYNIDIIGANLSLTKLRKIKYLASKPYDETYISLISSLQKQKIKSLKDLKNLRGVTLMNSSYIKIAQKLEKDYQTKITKLNNKNLFELLQMVVNGDYDFTFADANIIKLYKAYVPKLRIGKKLSKPSPLVFYTHKIDDSINEKLNVYIEQYISQNKVKHYKEFLIKILPNSKPADTVQFLKNYKQRWPKVRDLIYEVAHENNISPILLGAMSYQESHWNPKAVSPTLVKGLMMLTKAVAKEQHVNNRLDPYQSLQGGAKHFLKMMKVIPDRITEPDRTNFALAAYNLGYGNLEKARIITQKAGKNPDVWSDVKNYLPELNNLEGSKADGKTAVRYVENINVYQNLLQWKEQQ